LKVQGGIIGKYVADECAKLMGGYVAFKTSSSIILIISGLA
jgi:hypothetical protein